jgi:sporulation protein YlmC with PRC-barrel domain
VTDRPDVSAPGGRTLDAALHLLDRQLIDPDGMMVGKVDDLELTLSEHDPSEPPVVSAILTGPSALAPRLGRPGRMIASLLRAIRGHADPDRISFGVVAAIDDHIDLVVRRADLSNQVAERWVRDHVIGHLPGAGHAPD